MPTEFSSQIPQEGVHLEDLVVDVGMILKRTLENCGVLSLLQRTRIVQVL